MTPMVPSPANSADEETPRLPMPSRNPLPLSATQEMQVRDLYYARVRGYCADEIRGETFLGLTRYVVIEIAVLVGIPLSPIDGRLHEYSLITSVDRCLAWLT